MSDYIKREDAIFIALQQPIYSLVSEIKQLKGIDLDDYVPRDFHDKTCEAMAKAHQEEIADMVRVVRCKECRHKYQEPWHNGVKVEGECEIWHNATLDDDFCSYGERSKR